MDLLGGLSRDELRNFSWAVAIAVIDMKHIVNKTLFRFIILCFLN